MKKASVAEIYQVYLQHPTLSKDTRAISEGCIYLALKGEAFDGNKFAEDALKKGAACAIVDDSTIAKNEKYLLVDDVLATLQALANHHRKQLSIPVLAISGSNGKTTTKELIATALTEKYNVLFTDGNYNNHIGVPLTLLRINSSHEIAIIEMGANHQKEIEFLCGIAEPNFGILTNIGKAHLEGFGGEEGVRIGKTELFQYIAKSAGTLFINLDDEKIKKSIPEKVKTITYSLAQKTTASGEILTTHPTLSGNWKYKEEGGEINSSLYGVYNFYNILAACTIASYFNVPSEKITAVINSYESDMNRSQLIEKEGAKIYLDAYNANPSSMSLSLDNFNQAKENQKMAILGDMFELGETAEVEHQKIIQQAEKCDSIQTTVFVGHHFYSVKQERQNIIYFKETSDAKAWFQKQKLKEISILLKGSRGMKLESLLD